MIIEKGHVDDGCFLCDQKITARIANRRLSFFITDINDKTDYCNK